MAGIAEISCLLSLFYLSPSLCLSLHLCLTHTHTHTHSLSLSLSLSPSSSLSPPSSLPPPLTRQHELADVQQRYLDLSASIHAMAQVWPRIPDQTLWLLCPTVSLLV